MLTERDGVQIKLQCIEKGLVEGRVILTDSTHVKASASFKKNMKVLAERETTGYMERLNRYEAQKRERQEPPGAIKPQRASHKEKAPKLAEKTLNATDPDAGMLNRPGKPAGMHCLDHQSVDAKNGIIVDVAVTAGNMNGSGPYLERIEYMRDHLGLDIQTACADAAWHQHDLSGNGGYGHQAAHA